MRKVGSLVLLATQLQGLIFKSGAGVGRVLNGHVVAAIPGGEGYLTVRWETLDGLRVIQGVQSGELLRSALLKRGVSPHNGNAQLINCRGLGTCGTCAVEIDGAVEPSDRNARENLRLSLPPHTNSSHLRLACQCRVVGDVKVKKYAGFWGHRVDGLANAVQARAYLGDLEYALDPSAASIRCGVCGGDEFVACAECSGTGTDVRANRRSLPCVACRGSGFVICRSCFKGDPWDLDQVRARAARRPD
ncbi:hypothetical protein CTAYLR_002161 [Chrysophaeum taylorii]|uniref:2Fe-2S ferredoxin-type domain-containing protein n=1 Tax=Chrysophaeum taylorii TaxID=2483200 RepID=A0AAD7UPN8_9STRA|nr:hypothetical protein CTAYLR_002161 [Chrysophaeum taylorii]